MISIYIARKWFQVPGSKKADAHLVKMKHGVILKCVVYIHLSKTKTRAHGGCLGFL